MAMLPAEIHSALTQLLHGLQNPDNVVRTQAEEGLETQWVQPRPNVLLMGLVEQIQGAEDAAVRCPARVKAVRVANLKKDAFVRCCLVPPHINEISQGRSQQRHQRTIPASPRSRARRNPGKATSMPFG
jgi:hypothetical protein